LVTEQKLLDGMMELKKDRARVLQEMRQHGDKASLLFDSFVDLWLDSSQMSIEDFDLRPLAKELRCPALVMHSSLDPFTTFQAQIEPLLALAPRSSVQVHLLENVPNGRLPFLERARKHSAKTIVSQKTVSVIANFI
jgi:alpha-beta hydrolase superfamily lysophospholipase